VSSHHAAWATIVKEVLGGYAILSSIGVAGSTSIKLNRMDLGAPPFSSSFHPKPPTGPTMSALAVTGSAGVRWRNSYPTCLM
jgi:hypothetical protein